MSPHFLFRCGALGAVLGGVGGVMAATPGAAPPATVPSAASPRALSGGIGDAEIRSMREAARDYSLGLTFANPSGQLVADVDVSVSDATGRQVYGGVAQGPIVLIDLPAGRYTVTARYEGQSQARSVDLEDHKSRALTMSWPDKSVR